MSNTCRVSIAYSFTLRSKWGAVVLLSLVFSVQPYCYIISIISVVLFDCWRKHFTLAKRIFVVCEIVIFFIVIYCKIEKKEAY